MVNLVWNNINTIDSGIYAIINTQTGGIYIGSTIGFDRRKYKHMSALRHNYHHCQPLQNSFNKHGEESFRWCILSRIPNIYKSMKEFEKVLEDKEDLYTAFFGMDNLYNVGTTARAAMAGRKHTPEAIQKNRERNSGKNNAMFGKRGSLSPNWGRKATKEHCEKISRHHKGMKFSDTHKENMRLANKHKMKSITIQNKQSNETRNFQSLAGAAKDLNCSKTELSRLLARKAKSVKGWILSN